ncbi:alpha/beta hydrolase [Allorhizobium sp. BGMRC 0089]|uniref:alpha/beta hydrolase n=1 Tax=Allorhizobium sonneratiae TaxID=2934936 RepID=UPI002033A508|nr:alpha/beta hydrolase [Allorhizobium sonneratiae]MCM2292663.1 alpha/beta hydrolase [Allorhizobium sonneratiae]
MIGLSGIDWEDAFANGAYIEGAVDYPQRWAEEAARFRAETTHRADLAYGEAPRMVMDLLMPQGVSHGLAVFVHGGYWLAFDKSVWSAFAAAALAKGWSVALPSYPLAPEARISAMTQAIGQAITVAASQVEGPIRLAGHSAGGHLVTRMVCDDTPLADAVVNRIERVVSISGLHDLRPLRLNSMNERLMLSEEEALTESPALHAPKGRAEVIAWVGGQERPEFLRQAAFLAEAWRLKGAATRLVVESGTHHFNVIDGLKQADHPLAHAFCGKRFSPDLEQNNPQISI